MTPRRSAVEVGGREGYASPILSPAGPGITKEDLPVGDRASFSVTEKRISPVESAGIPGLKLKFGLSRRSAGSARVPSEGPESETHSRSRSRSSSS